MDENKALDIVAQRLYQQESKIKASTNQRRDFVTDINGTELWDYGDSESPAEFEILLPKDLREIMRYEIRIRIKRYRAPVALATGTASLSIVGETDESIPANPHKHGKGTLSVSPNPHSHSVAAQVTEVDSNPDNFTFKLNGHDFTEEMKATFPEYPNGFGSFPAESTFDLKLLAENLPNWKRGLLLSAGMKRIDIGANGLFECRLVLYIKYSHKGRGGLY